MEFDRFAVVLLVRTMPWSVPAGAMHVAPTRLPRSMADVLDGFTRAAVCG